MSIKSKSVLAIDPGNEESAYVHLLDGMPVGFEKLPNNQLLVVMHDITADYLTHLAIETMYPRGMPTSFEEMQTQLWAGRFIQKWDWNYTQVFRKDVKMKICGNARANDSNIRQALIDRYGGKATAIGKKAAPGPLHGMSGDCWSALAIAVTWAETHLQMAS